MTLSIRTPLRVEQALAEYCVAHKTTRSTVVQRLLEDFLERQPTTLPVFVGCDEGDGTDVSGNIKKMLRERFRPI